MHSVDVIRVMHNPTKKIRVAGYARVSTSDEHQNSSYRLQIQELENDIKSNSSYEFIGIFKDKKSAATTNRRQEFNTMIELALMGEIDIILTKSITRFARNLVDTISIVRQLKINNVEVIFQKENISSLDPSIEMLLSILAMHAEEEIRNISENTLWSIKKKRRAGGNFTTNIYGYRIKDDVWTIIDEEAKVVRIIFDMYINNKTYKEIINRLFKMKVKTPRGANRWSLGTLERMLQNEKYAGHMSLGKTYMHNGISIRSNRLEVENNTIKHHHEPIISPDTFNQAMQIRRERTKNTTDGYIPFSKRVTPYYQFVYSVKNENFLRYVLERPKGKYEIPTLYCYDANNKNRIMITIKNLFLILNDALYKLSESVDVITNAITSLLNTSLKNCEHQLETSNEKILLLNTKINLLNAKRNFPSFIKHLRNFSGYENIDDFKKLVQCVDILEDGNIKIKLALLQSDLLNVSLLESSITLRVGNGNKDLVFFVFI